MAQLPMVALLAVKSSNADLHSVHLLCVLHTLIKNESTIQISDKRQSNYPELRLNHMKVYPFVMDTLL